MAPSASESGKPLQKAARGEKAKNGGIPEHPANVTALLLKWGKGDEAALERLIPLVHRELHQIARRCRAGERGGHSLQATALLNEAYLRLVDAKDVAWHDRAHSSRCPQESCAGSSSTMRAHGTIRSVAAMRFE
jgi:hypothetical protein